MQKSGAFTPTQEENTGCRVSNEAEARTSPINPPNLHETGKRDLCCEGLGTGRASASDHDRHLARGPASPTRTATEATCPHSCRFVGPRPLAGFPCHWPGHRATGHSVRRASEACRTQARNLSAGDAPARPATGPGSTVLMPSSGHPRGCIRMLGTSTFFPKTENFLRIFQNF